MLPFFFMLGKKIYQLISFVYFSLRKYRSSHHIIKHIFPRRRNRLIYHLIKAIHIQIIPGNIIYCETFFFSSSKIMGNLLNVTRLILSGIRLPPVSSNFSQDTLFIFIIFSFKPFIKTKINTLCLIIINFKIVYLITFIFILR